MKIFMTGATGFVGNHLLKRLVQENCEILCLVRDQDKATNLQNKYNVRTVIGDITKAETLHNIDDDVDIVIHLAAMGHVSAISQESYDKFVEINEIGTKNVIDHFRNSKQLKKFIHFSSTAAMGPIGDPILDENSTPNPLTPYQKSKCRSENISIGAYREFSFPSIVIRPCMIYGPGGYGEFYKFCRLMKKGYFPKVGLGENLTPLVYIDDVVNATLLAMEKGKVGETYIIASEKSLPMDELHSYIMKSMKYKAPYIYIPTPIALLGGYMLEKICVLLKKEPIASYRNIKSTVTDRTFNISKAKQKLGYSQQMPFEKGIGITIDWYKSQGKL